MQSSGGEDVDQAPPLTRLDVLLRYGYALTSMVFYGGVLVFAVSKQPSRFGELPVELGLSVAALVLMHWRRRWPVPIAVITALFTAFSEASTGPAQIAYASLCTHRRWRQIIPAAALSELCLVFRSTWGGIDQTSFIGIGFGSAVLAGVTVAGLYVRSRRDLALAQREQQLALEREHEDRVERAKLAERAQIAREMHDVLAHRISLLALHAGALAYRKDLSADEVRDAARVIQDNAHRSLTELRTVLGTLRDESAPEAPQPSLTQLSALLAEVGAAGQQVELDDQLLDRDLLPTQTGRHTYRIVQEALTNARKHAPGMPVRLGLSGRPGGEIRVLVSNELVLGRTPGDGGRLGLVGLAERTLMAGGVLKHAVEDHRFVLDARLPWEA